MQPKRGNISFISQPITKELKTNVMKKALKTFIFLFALLLAGLFLHAANKQRKPGNQATPAIVKANPQQDISLIPSIVIL